MGKSLASCTGSIAHQRSSKAALTTLTHQSFTRRRLLSREWKCYAKSGPKRVKQRSAAFSLCVQTNATASHRPVSAIEICEGNSPKAQQRCEVGSKAVATCRVIHLISKRSRHLQMTDSFLVSRYSRALRHRTSRMEIARPTFHWTSAAETNHHDFELRR